MSQLAQSVERAVKEMIEKDRAKREQRSAKVRQPVREPQQQMGATAMAKTATTVRKRATKKKDTAEAGDNLGGIRKKPKNKVLFINTDLGRTVTYRALKASNEKWTDDEQREVDRLIARLEARGM